MKRKTIWTTTIATNCLLLLLLAGCGTGSDNGHDGAKHRLDLTTQIKNSLAPMGIQLNPGEVSIKDEELSPSNKASRQLVTFKNPVFSITPQEKNVKKSSGFMPDVSSVKMEQLTLRYGKKDRFLQIVSIEGLKIDFSVPNIAEEAEEDRKESGVKLTISTREVEFEDYVINEVLSLKSDNPKELMMLLMGKKVMATSTSKGIHYQLEIPFNDQITIGVGLDVEQLVSNQGLNREVFAAAYGLKNKTPLPNFENLLEEGHPLFDIHLKGEGIKFAVTMNGAPIGDGAFGGIQLAYFLKPDDLKRNYQWGAHCELKNFNAQIPLLASLQDVTQLEEIGLDVKIMRISPSLLEAYFQMVKKLAEVEPTASEDEIRKYKSAYGAKLFMEAAKSHPKIKFSLSPFKHPFGELKLGGSFSFTHLAFPVGKAVVTIKNFPQVMHNLKQKEFLQTLLGNSIFLFLEKTVDLQENGTGKITFETKEEYPGQLFINGKALN